MNKTIKKIIIWLCVIGGFIALVSYCSHRIDQNRAEKNERKEKLENGTCEFDQVDLENLVINYGDDYFKPVLDLEGLKKMFSAELGKIDLNDTSQALKEVRINNSDVTFYKRGSLAAINSIEVDLSSQFKFKLNDRTVFSSDYKLDEFEKEFSKSYSCRENIVTTAVTEVYAMRIDNANQNSKLKFIILQFNRGDKLKFIQFFYEGINL